MRLAYFQVRNERFARLVIVDIYGTNRCRCAFHPYPNLLPAIPNPDRRAQFVLRLLLHGCSLRFLLGSRDSRLLRAIRRRRWPCFHPEMIGGLELHTRTIAQLRLINRRRFELGTHKSKIPDTVLWLIASCQLLFAHPVHRRFHPHLVRFRFQGVVLNHRGTVTKWVPHPSCPLLQDVGQFVA